MGIRVVILMVFLVFGLFNSVILGTPIYGTESDLSTYLFIISLVAIVLSGYGIIRLFIRQKESATIRVTEFEEKYENIQKAYQTLKQVYTKVKNSDAVNQSKVKELRSKIVELEKANVTLIEKKIKLESKKAELELLQEKKDKIFAISIHDIKNPINAIRGYVELIKSYDLTATEQQTMVDAMLASADKIISVSQKLTDILISENFENVFAEEAVSLRNIVDEVCKLNSAYVKTKGINLINRVKADLPLARANKEKIEDVVDNLINNAIKYGPEGTTIQIIGYDKDGFVHLDVIDDGVGLSDEDKSKAFSKGAILSSAPTGEEGQTGLGLWIVKEIVEEFGGEVWVHSQLGKGSTFGFKLHKKD